MRASTVLTGMIFAGALGFGVVSASADSTNGPDAGIGIAGYNVGYEHSADGQGPGYPRSWNEPQPSYQYGYRGPHRHYRPY